MMKSGIFGFALLLFLGLATPQGEAVPITGKVYFGGFEGVTLTGGAQDFATATGLDFVNSMDAFVSPDSTGDFSVPDVSDFDDLTWATFYDFTFLGLPADVWHIETMGFTFKLNPVLDVERLTSGIILSGSGEVRSSDPNKDPTPGTFQFSLQGEDLGNSTFSFSANSDFTAVPDGGASAVLLGLGLLGLAACRRILSK